MSPAVKAHRKYLVDDIHHARIIEDKEALEKLQTEFYSHHEHFSKWSSYPPTYPL